MGFLRRAAFSVMLWVGILAFTSIVFLFLSAEANRRARTFQVMDRVGATDRETRIEWRLDSDAPLISGIIRRLRLLSKRIAPSEVLADTGRRLKWAGMTMAAEEFYAVRLAAAIVSAGITLTLSLVGMGMKGAALVIVAAALGYLLPDMWLTSRVRARQAAVERQLLGFLDMLTVATEAGLNLGNALQQVSAQIGGVLGAEFVRATEEVRLGMTRASALARVADRIGLDDLTNAVAAVTEAERTGTPIATVLRQQAESIRQARQLRAQEMAQKMAVKIMVPVMVFIFLPMMVIMLGPAIVNLAGALGM